MSYSRVRIAARLRPAIPGEPHDNAIRVIHSDAGSAISVDNPRDPSQTFKYPSVFLKLLVLTLSLTTGLPQVLILL